MPDVAPSLDLLVWTLIQYQEYQQILLTVMTRRRRHVHLIPLYCGSWKLQPSNCEAVIR